MRAKSHFTNPRKAAFAVALGSMIVLSACNEAMLLAPGGIDPNDSCSRFQQAIVDARAKENQLRVQNVALGALTGAAIGATLAGGDNRQGGALAGLVIGGILADAGTVQNQQNQRNVDAALLKDINSKAGTATRLLTDGGKAASSLRNCRLGQIKSLERSVRNKAISTDSARAQLIALQRRAAVDNRVISNFFNGVGNKVDTFVSTGARANGVEQAILTRQKPAQTSAARQVRSSTPNVPRAIAAKNRVQTADERQRRTVDRGLESIEVLLG